MFDKKEKWDWKFRTESDSDYELKMTFTIKDSFFMKVFNSGVIHFARSHGVTPKGDVGLIDAFDVDEVYLPKVKAYIKKVFNITANDIYRQSGRYLVNYDVSNVRYERIDTESWRMIVTVKGVFNLK